MPSESNSTLNASPAPTAADCSVTATFISRMACLIAKLVCFSSSSLFIPTRDSLACLLLDWNELFTTKCYSCGFPIEAGDRWVEAMNNNYHSQCFNCSVNSTSPTSFICDPIIVFECEHFFFFIRFARRTWKDRAFWAKMVDRCAKATPAKRRMSCWTRQQCTTDILDNNIRGKGGEQYVFSHHHHHE